MGKRGFGFGVTMALEMCVGFWGYVFVRYCVRLQVGV
jgi:hypothetical protein